MRKGDTSGDAQPFMVVLESPSYSLTNPLPKRPPHKPLPPNQLLPIPHPRRLLPNKLLLPRCPPEAPFPLLPLRRLLAPRNLTNPTMPRLQHPGGNTNNLIVKGRQGGDSTAANGAEGAGERVAGLRGGVGVGGYAGGAGVQRVLLRGE